VNPATTPNPPFADDPIPDPPPSSGGSSTGGDTIYTPPVSSAPTQAEKDAATLAAFFGNNATVSGSTVTLKGDANIYAGETLPIPAGVTLNTAGNDLTVANGAALTVAAGGIIDLGAGTITVETDGEDTGTVTNNGTIKTANDSDDTLIALVALEGTGKVVLNGAVTDPLTAPLDLSVDLEIGTGGSITFTGSETTAFSGEATVTISGTGILDLGSTITTLGVTVTNTAQGIIKTANQTMLETLLDSGTGVTAGTVEVSGEVELSGGEVKDNVTLKVASGTLTLDTDANIIVNGELDLSGLEDTDEKAVALSNGTITVASDGKLYAPENHEGTNIATKIPQIDWDSGGSIVLKGGSEIQVGGTVFIGPEGEYTWEDTTSTVTLKEGEIELDGKLTSAKDNTINDAVTIKDDSTLKVADTLTFEEDGTLNLEGNGKVVVNGAEAVLDLVALEDPDSVKLGSGESIVVENSGTVRALEPASGQIDWSEGSIVFKNGTTLYIRTPKFGADVDVPYLGTAGAAFTWEDESTSVTLEANKMTVEGDLTSNGITNPLTGTPPLFPNWISDAAIIKSGTLTIKNNTILLVADNATITVKGGAILDVDGTLAIEKTTSKLILEPGGKVDVAQTGTFKGWTEPTTPKPETSVKVYVYNYNSETGVDYTEAQGAEEADSSESPDWILKAVDATYGEAIENITLGKFVFSTSASAVDGVEGGNGGTDAGSLEADDDTAIVFTGDVAPTP
jgi:hypothetical protein